MIIIQWKFWASGCLFVLIFVVLSALYAYRTNAKRAGDDPEKKDYSPYSPWLAPFIFPLLVLINVPVFLLSGLVFGIFLVLFPFSLLLFRKPFLIKWIRKQMLKVGNMMLKINTSLLRTVGIEPAVWRFQVEPKVPTR